MISDAQILDFLLTRIGYVELNNANGTPTWQQDNGEGYWPVVAEHDTNPKEEYIGLSLRKYVEFQISKEAHRVTGA